jgi:hypothetical protein
VLSEIKVSYIIYFYNTEGSPYITKNEPEPRDFSNRRNFSAGVSAANISLFFTLVQATNNAAFLNKGFYNPCCN